jgi:hypothetical protein
LQCLELHLAGMGITAELNGISGPAKLYCETVCVCSTETLSSDSCLFWLYKVVMPFKPTVHDGVVLGFYNLSYR